MPACRYVEEISLPATNRLAGVTPEVNLREHVTHTPLQVQISMPTLALKPRGTVTRSPKQGRQWPTKRIYILQKLFFKKSSSLRHQNMILQFKLTCLITGHFPERCITYPRRYEYYAPPYVKRPYYYSLPDTNNPGGCQMHENAGFAESPNDFETEEECRAACIGRTCLSLKN